MEEGGGAIRGVTERGNWGRGEKVGREGHPRECREREGHPREGKRTEGGREGKGRGGGGKKEVRTREAVWEGVKEGRT